MKLKLLSFPFLYLSIFLLLFAACQSSSESEAKGGAEADKKANIVATTAMIGDVIENITGDWAEVISLMGPGVDPHLYKATQGDLKKLQKADIIFYNGLHLEGKMQEIFEKLANRKPVKAISEDIPESRQLKLDEDGKTVTDPHFWFDIELWQSGVKVIAKNLSELYPNRKAEILKKSSDYIQKLSDLDKKVKTEIQSIPDNQRILITSHDAFGYFENAYSIEVRALQGLSTVTEFGLKDLTDLVNFIVERKIKAIFIESSVASKPMDAIVKGCKEKGHNIKIGGVLYSDAMGEYGTTEGTYVGMVEHNLRTIVHSLK